jgi:hypothetical protein
MCRAVAREVLEGATSAELQVIARAAAHRLERGIWTSPGAGDVRRAIAACERLVLLCGESAPSERRDLAALYIRQGMLEKGKIELQTYQESMHARCAGREDRRCVEGLWEAVRDMEIEEGLAALTLEGSLAMSPPDVDAAPPLPLTW